MEVFAYGTLTPGRLLRRSNRFVCEVELEADPGQGIECYIPNPGSMLGMCVKDAPVRLSTSTGPGRKFKYTVEAIKIGPTWIGCNTQIANRITARILRAPSRLGVDLPFKFDSFKSEVRLSNSRIDFVLSDSETGVQSFVEVKTVTMASDWFDIETNHIRADKPFHRFPDLRPEECTCERGLPKVALFPDCESVRALRHISEMAVWSEKTGNTAGLIYTVMRDDVDAVMPSFYCDPNYARAATTAFASGIVCIALKCRLDVDDPERARILLVGQLPIKAIELQEQLAEDSHRGKKRKRR